jgi:hypothetical protein
VGSIDRYLMHTFDAIENEILAEEKRVGKRQSQQAVRLPMLVRIKGTAASLWNPRKLPDCSVVAQLGNTIAILGSLRTVAALQDDPTVLAVEASRPGSSRDCVRSLPFVHANVVHEGLSEKGDMALVAIIDEDIDILHNAFLDSTGKHTRILAIWDQTDPTGPPPNVDGLGESAGGTEHTESQINQYIQSGNIPPNLGEFLMVTGPMWLVLRLGVQLDRSFPAVLLLKRRSL